MDRLIDTAKRDGAASSRTADGHIVILSAERLEKLLDAARTGGGYAILLCMNAEAVQ
jgi:hypothetical protein